MAIQRIPLNASLPKQTATIRLGASTFRYRVRWLSRVPGPGDGGGFYIDFYTVEGDPLVEGVRLVPWAAIGDVPNIVGKLPLTLRFPDSPVGGDPAGIEPGVLILVDREGSLDTYPEIDGFEERFALVWADRDGLVELVPSLADDEGDDD